MGKTGLVRHCYDYEFEKDEYYTFLMLAGAVTHVTQDLLCTLSHRTCYSERED